MNLGGLRWEAPGYVVAGTTLAAAGYFFYAGALGRKSTFTLLEEKLRVEDPNVQESRKLANRSVRLGYSCIGLSVLSGGYIFYSFREVSDPPSISYRMRW